MAKLPTDPDVMPRTVVDIAAASFTNARDLLTRARAVLKTPVAHGFSRRRLGT
ncbi:hypothetical protein OG920_43320 [Streptomyces europaeiscabiei]|uniref:hypothetical protein n=1 Tax=Streptomyces europaeiscabiei TaxID=146819 RepID=UPI0030E59B66